MPAAVQNPRYQQLLQRLFGLRESRAFDVEDIVLPVAPIFTGGEHEFAFLRGERAMMGCASQAAVAAQFGFVALENPLQSGGLIIVDAVAPTVPPTALLLMGLLQSTGLGASLGAVKSPRDGRGWKQGSVSFGDLRAGSDVNDPTVAGQGFGFMVAGGSTPSAMPFGIVIPPGWSLVCKGIVVNSTVQRVSFMWRERALETTEA